MIDVGPFCIDATEVTNKQYDDFLLSTPNAADQPPECSWNASFLPGNNWTYDPAKAELPVVYVNWCDALAFCRWAGKRLCGRVDGGAADYANFSDPANEHYYACSGQGSRVYPYGNTFQAGACNVVDYDAGGPVAVGSLPGCEGAYPGLFDMIGNVEEWQNACTDAAGPDDQCRSGTGSFSFYPGNASMTNCALDDNDSRNSAFRDLGIRCCAR
jgi:formylglycine-generating enzyme required for sulfatase activity